MKKTISILILLVLNFAFSQAQTLPEQKQYEDLRAYGSLGSVEKYYRAVRIGEYYWIDQNMNHQKAHQYAPDWSTPRWEVTWANEEELQKYLNFMKLQRDQVPFTMEEFNNIYGAYYHEYSIYGKIAGNGVFHHRMDDPGWLQIKRLNPKYENTPSDQMDKWRRYDLNTASTYRTANIGDWKQLLGMVPLKDKTLSLDVLDVRSHLSTKRGENPLAYDYWTDSNHRTYWFEIAKNTYGFNMMPGGGRVDYYKQIDMKGYPTQYLHRGDFYQLFHVAKYAIGGVNGGQSLDIEDYIHFYPNDEESLSIDNGTWYNVRFCRPLTVEELGYRLFYNNNAERPDIVKRTINLSDPTPPTGYTELENGYLRGFYVANYMDKQNPKYSLREIVKMADCVLEFGKKVDVEKCACDPDYYLVDHLSLMVNDDFINDYTLIKNQEFQILAPSNDQDKIHIGLFNAQSGEFIDRLDVSRHDNDVEVYNCVMKSTARRSQKYVIQAFYYDGVDEIPSNVKAIGRILGSEADSHIIDQLPIEYKPTARDMALGIENYENPVIALTGHLEFSFSGTRPDNQKNIFEVVQEEEFIVKLPFDKQQGADLRIGLFSADDGSFLNRLDIDSEDNNPLFRTFRCKVPGKTIYNRYLYPDNIFVVIPYYVDDKNPESTITKRRKVSKHSQERAIIDRLPLYVNEMSSRSMFTTSTEEMKLSVSVSPNPVSDILTVHGNFNEVLEIQVFGITGAISKTAKKSNTIDLSTLPTGVYKVRIVTDMGEETLSVMKK